MKARSFRLKSTVSPLRSVQPSAFMCSMYSMLTMKPRRSFKNRSSSCGKRSATLQLTKNFSPVLSSISTAWSRLEMLTTLSKNSERSALPTLTVKSGRFFDHFSAMRANASRMASVVTGLTR